MPSAADSAASGGGRGGARFFGGRRRGYEYDRANLNPQSRRQPRIAPGEEEEPFDETQYLYDRKRGGSGGLAKDHADSDSEQPRKAPGEEEEPYDETQYLYDRKRGGPGGLAKDHADSDSELAGNNSGGEGQGGRGGGKNAASSSPLPGSGDDAKPVNPQDFVPEEFKVQNPEAEFPKLHPTGSKSSGPRGSGVKLPPGKRFMATAVSAGHGLRTKSGSLDENEFPTLAGGGGGGGQEVGGSSPARKGGGKRGGGATSRSRPESPEFLAGQGGGGSQGSGALSGTVGHLFGQQQQTTKKRSNHPGLTMTDQSEFPTLPGLEAPLREKVPTVAKGADGKTLAATAKSEIFSGGQNAGNARGSEAISQQNPGSGNPTQFQKPPSASSAEPACLMPVNRAEVEHKSFTDILGVSMEKKIGLGLWSEKSRQRPDSGKIRGEEFPGLGGPGSGGGSIRNPLDQVAGPGWKKNPGGQKTGGFGGSGGAGRSKVNPMPTEMDFPDIAVVRKPKMKKMHPLKGSGKNVQDPDTEPVPDSWDAPPSPDSEYIAGSSSGVDSTRTKDDYDSRDLSTSAGIPTVPASNDDDDAVDRFGNNISPRAAHSAEKSSANSARFGSAKNNSGISAARKHDAEKIPQSSSGGDENGSKSRSDLDYPSLPVSEVRTNTGKSQSGSSRGGKKTGNKSSWQNSEKNHPDPKLHSGKVSDKTENAGEESDFPALPEASYKKPSSSNLNSSKNDSRNSASPRSYELKTLDEAEHVSDSDNRQVPSSSTVPFVKSGKSRKNQQLNPSKNEADFPSLAKEVNNNRNNFEDSKSGKTNSLHGSVQNSADSSQGKKKRNRKKGKGPAALSILDDDAEQKSDVSAEDDSNSDDKSAAAEPGEKIRDLKGLTASLFGSMMSKPKSEDSKSGVGGSQNAAASNSKDSTEQEVSRPVSGGFDRNRDENRSSGRGAGNGKNRGSNHGPEDRRKNNETSSAVPHSADRKGHEGPAKGTKGGFSHTAQSYALDDKSMKGDLDRDRGAGDPNPRQNQGGGKKFSQQRRQQNEQPRSRRDNNSQPLFPGPPGAKNNGPRTSGPRDSRDRDEVLQLVRQMSNASNGSAGSGSSGSTKETAHFSSAGKAMTNGPQGCELQEQEGLKSDPRAALDRARADLIHSIGTSGDENFGGDYGTGLDMISGMPGNSGSAMFDPAISRPISGSTKPIFDHGTTVGFADSSGDHQGFSRNSAQTFGSTSNDLSTGGSMNDMGLGGGMGMLPPGLPPGLGAPVGMGGSPSFSGVAPPPGLGDMGPPLNPGNLGGAGGSFSDRSYRPPLNHQQPQQSFSNSNLAAGPPPPGITPTSSTLPASAFRLPSAGRGTVAIGKKNALASAGNPRFGAPQMSYPNNLARSRPGNNNMMSSASALQPKNADTQDNSRGGEHTFSKPPDYGKRQHLLHEAIESALTPEDFFEFKVASGQFRRNDKTAKEFYDLLKSWFPSPDIFAQVFPDLLTLLPDIEKQHALRDADFGKSCGAAGVRPCSICYQLLAKSDVASHKASHGK